MTNIKDGGPAFPRPISHDETPSGMYQWDSVQYERAQSGMSLRDWFAGVAIGGQSANDGGPTELATWAYAVADAMLKAREEGGAR